ncbi:hypothetical protein [Nannocystis pusilla]|uniref:hypothetical protein n=1 Tax=Nannocystis pusilla TaxID=889268 RepID=UPI003B7AEE7F
MAPWRMGIAHLRFYFFPAAVPTRTPLLVRVVRPTAPNAAEPAVEFAEALADAKAGALAWAWSGAGEAGPRRRSATSARTSTTRTRRTPSCSRFTVAPSSCGGPPRSSDRPRLRSALAPTRTRSGTGSRPRATTTPSSPACAARPRGSPSGSSPRPTLAWSTPRCCSSTTSTG